MGDVKVLRVGLTGGIASGKSTVTRMLRSLGAVVLDADQAAREVVEPKQPAWRRIRSVFGPEFFHADGQLDRKKLGGLVFADATARRQLDEIIHPEVFAFLERQVEELAAAAQHRLVCLDIPLLFETGYNSQVDVTVVVFVDGQTQLRRLMDRDNLSEQEAQERIAAQMPLSEKARLADYVIDNNETLEATQQQVTILWQRLCQRAETLGV